MNLPHFAKVLLAGSLMLVLSSCSGSAYDREEEEPPVEVREPGTSVHAEPIGPDCGQYPDLDDWATQPLSETLAGPNFTQYRRVLSAAELAPTIDELYLDSTLFIPTNAAWSELDPFFLETLSSDPVLAKKAIEDKIVPEPFEGIEDLNAAHQTVAGPILAFTGENPDYTINEEASIVCGGIPVEGGRVIYLIDRPLIS